MGAAVLIAGLVALFLVADAIVLVLVLRRARRRAGRPWQPGSSAPLTAGRNGRFGSDPWDRVSGPDPISSTDWSAGSDAGASSTDAGNSSSDSSSSPS